MSPAGSPAGEEAREIVVIPEPSVSIIMPTYRQAWSIRAAIDSALRQSVADWEMIVVDDGSPDETAEVLEPFTKDERIRVVRHDVNEGLGRSLNDGVERARSDLVAYLPSDDVWYPDHLERLLDVLADPQVQLAYGGIRWSRGLHLWEDAWEGATLLGDDFRPGVTPEEDIASFSDRHPFAQHAGNILKMTQVLHRRPERHAVRWTERDEHVSDQIEGEYWRALLRRGAVFRYAGAVTCEWTDHHDQRHKIIAAGTNKRPPISYVKSGRGLSAYRSYYGVPPGRSVDWRPSSGLRRDEAAYYRDVTASLPPDFSPPPSLRRVLVAGELSYNPERMVAFDAAGIRTWGLWAPNIEIWDTASSLPVSACEPVLFDRHWRAKVAEIRPDVIYGLLNFQSIPTVHSVVEADLGIPLVYHFKESPLHAIRYGMWDMLHEILRAAAGLVFLNPKSREWFDRRLPGLLDDKPVLLMDGDRPPACRMTDEWATKLSATDRDPHTVCVGRPIGLEDLDELIGSRVHVHFYGEQYSDPGSPLHQHYRPWIERYRDSPFFHTHPAVDPGSWTRELSRYDAAWLHAHRLRSRTELSVLEWLNANFPARLGTYASAGLPWLIMASGPREAAVGELASELGNGLFLESLASASDVLRDTDALQTATRNAVANRRRVSFEHDFPRLLDFLAECAQK